MAMAYSQQTHKVYSNGGDVVLIKWNLVLCLSEQEKCAQLILSNEHELTLNWAKMEDFPTSASPISNILNVYSLLSKIINVMHDSTYDNTHSSGT